MAVPRLFRVAALASAALMATAHAAGPDGQFCAPDRSISVNGEGQVKKTPDLVTVTFGVVTNASTAQAAYDANARATAAAVQFLANDLGIDRKDIRLAGLSLDKKTEFIPGDNGRPGRTVDAGYEASRTITVELRDSSGNGTFALLAPLISGVVASGANRLQGVSYGLQDPGQARAEALTVATQDAMRRAQAIVTGLGTGYSLGAVRTVSESSVSVPRPVFRTAFAAAAPAAQLSTADTLPAGDITIEASVSMVAELQGGGHADRRRL